MQRGFDTGQLVWDPKFLSQINEIFAITMSDTIVNYVITTFSIVNKSCP